MDKLKKDEAYRAIGVKLTGQAIGNILFKQDEIVDWINAHDKPKGGQMLDQTLVSRCFRWDSVCLRKCGQSFTAAESKSCIDKALESLPANDDAKVYEVIIKQGTVDATIVGEIELQTVIYWKSQE